MAAPSVAAAAPMSAGRRDRGMGVANVLALQSAAGNAAVSRMLSGGEAAQLARAGMAGGGAPLRRGRARPLRAGVRRRLLRRARAHRRRGRGRRERARRARLHRRRRHRLQPGRVRARVRRRTRAARPRARARRPAGQTAAPSPEELRGLPARGRARARRRRGGLGRPERRPRHGQRGPGRRRPQADRALRPGHHADREQPVPRRHRPRGDDRGGAPRDGPGPAGRARRAPGQLDARPLAGAHPRHPGQDRRRRPDLRDPQRALDQGVRPRLHRERVRHLRPGRAHRQPDRPARVRRQPPGRARRQRCAGAAGPVEPRRLPDDRRRPRQPGGHGEPGLRLGRPALRGDRRRNLTPARARRRSRSTRTPSRAT